MEFKDRFAEFKNLALSFSEEDRFKDGERNEAVIRMAEASAKIHGKRAAILKHQIIRKKMAVYEEIRKASKDKEKLSGKDSPVQRTEINEKQTAAQVKALRNDAAKKEAAKETKKAARSASVARLFRTKGMIKEGFGEGNESGDALKDAEKGIAGIVMDAINPVTYIKKYAFQLSLILAPYMTVSLLFTLLFLIITALVCGAAESPEVTAFMTGAI